jgi:hypothetical protein
MGRMVDATSKKIVLGLLKVASATITRLVTSEPAWLTERTNQMYRTTEPVRANHTRFISELFTEPLRLRKATYLGVLRRDHRNF